MSYYEDDTITLHHGDALNVLRGMADQSVDCCVTSPPYFGLRDYGVDGQIGVEKMPAEFVERLRALFAEVRRVLAHDGTFWLNLGDSYSSGSRTSYDTVGGKTRAQGLNAARQPSSIPDKNLLGIPWRVAFALQDDGWVLRNAIVWHKPNAMPESVVDRMSTRYEMVFLFSKSRKYWFDIDAVREPLAYPEAADGSRVFGGKNKGSDGGVGSTSRRRGGNAWTPKATKTRPAGTPTTAAAVGAATDADTSAQTDSGIQGRNPGDVWTIPTTPFAGAHFAVYPPALVERCVLAGCRPGGVVLDPFSGSGTTGMVALKHGRKYVGIELNAEYLDLSLRTRLHTGVLDFGSAS